MALQPHQSMLVTGTGRAHPRVLAIIPSGKNWMVLLNRKDIAALLAGAKEPHVLRLEEVAGR